MFGTFAFSMVGYSFAAAQNVTSTAPAPTGNLTGNATGGNATGGNMTGGSNATGGNVTAPGGNVTGGNETTTAGEANSFLARGLVAGMASDELLGGRFKIDVKDGQAQRVEVNITMAKPDGSDFHTHLIDNFTAGGGANETTVSNATGAAGANATSGNQTSGNATGGSNATGGGNTTGGNATIGGGTTLTLPQIMTGGNTSGATDNATAPSGNATGGNMTGGNETGGNATMPGGNATGNETSTAGTVTLSQDGTFKISGTANIYTDNSPEWQNVPITIEGNGRILSIEVDDQATDNHFGGEPIHAFVTALFGDMQGGKQSFLPPLETEAPAGPPMPVEPGGGIGGNMTGGNETGGNATMPGGNATAPAGNASGGNQTPSAGGGGGGTDVSITAGSSSKTDNAFDPNPVEVKVGDTVTWTNDDTTPHTVTSGSNGQPDGKFDSSPGMKTLIAPGQTFEHTFDQAGEFPYYCQLHPQMVGTVSVS